MTKIIFFGNERLATNAPTSAPTLRKLIEAGYEIEAVVASHIDPLSRQKRDLEIGIVAKSYGIPVILTDKNMTLIDKIRHYNAEAAVLIAFGQMIPKEVIEFFPKGIINIHPSLLPRLRGPTPIETVILDGLEETGVSIMQLASKMDAGPVYVQEKYSLSGKETKHELAEKLNNIGADLLVRHLKEILDGTLVPGQQNEDQATFSKLIRKEDGQIEWTKSAARLEREVRAYAKWPQSKSKLGSVEVIITKAHVESGDLNPGIISIKNGHMAVGTGSNLLYIDEIKPLGKKEMPISAFLAGYRSQL